MHSFPHEYGAWCARKVDDNPNFDWFDYEMKIVDEHLELIEACMNDVRYFHKIISRNEEELRMIEKRKWKWHDDPDIDIYSLAYDQDRIERDHLYDRYTRVKAVTEFIKKIMPEQSKYANQ